MSRAEWIGKVDISSGLVAGLLYVPHTGESPPYGIAATGSMGIDTSHESRWFPRAGAEPGQ